MILCGVGVPCSKGTTAEPQWSPESWPQEIPVSSAGLHRKQDSWSPPEVWAWLLQFLAFLTLSLPQVNDDVPFSNTEFNLSCVLTQTESQCFLHLPFALMAANLGRREQKRLHQNSVPAYFLFF